METPKTILIIEDDSDTRRMAREVLANAGYRVLEADGISVGRHLFQAQIPDLLILDINLPDGNGLELCKKIRESNTRFDTPIIMLTGHGKLDEKVLGFSAGADHYLVKPVSPRELLLWVESLLRRLSFDKEETKSLVIGNLAIDLDAHLVSFQGQVISHLTGKEFDLLYFLVKKRPRVLTRKYILSTLWHTIAVDHVVDTHFSNLRKKLPTALADKIQTVPGKGFRYFE